ncbi:MAG: four helix bundle protein [Patescibacteria group bacterium]|nr:four helix bundle protein [Patescibacteria group bacterium]
MTNDKSIKKYDLEERTARFGEDVLNLCKKIRRDELSRPVIDQLVKCGTSIGANYCEADDAESKADFRHKIGICKKESREAKHFLRMSSVVAPELKVEARILWTEAKELNLIFNAIFKKVRKISN